MAAKEPILLHSEVKTNENEELRPFDRQPTEPALWYQRFRNYCLLGIKRSLQAALALEAQAEETSEVPDGTENKFSEPDGASQNDNLRKVSHSVPGSWKRASIKYRWVERAKAYDVARREKHQEWLLNRVYDEAKYASRSQRVIALSNLVSTLNDYLRDGSTRELVTLDQRDRMHSLISGIKCIQSLLRDIRKEMDALDKEW